MVNGFQRLGHDAVVGGDHQHCNVGHSCASSPDGCERCVTRSVQERNGVAVRFNLVGTDMLRDAAHFFVCHLGVFDGVQQRGFAVVYVAKNSDHWRAGHEF